MERWPGEPCRDREPKPVRLFIPAKRRRLIDELSEVPGAPGLRSELCTTTVAETANSHYNLKVFRKNRVNTRVNALVVLVKFVLVVFVENAHRRIWVRDVALLEGARWWWDDIATSWCISLLTWCRREFTRKLTCLLYESGNPKCMFCLERRS